MKKFALTLILIQLILIAIALISHAHAAPNPRPDVYTICNGGAHSAIIKEIEAATTKIRMLCYSFNDMEIADALEAAIGRGVNVSVIMDKGQYTKNPIVQYFYLDKHIPFMLDSVESIMHMKVIICDDRYIMLGSYNFTRAARIFYAECLYIFDSSTIAAKLDTSFNYHLGHSTPPPSSLKGMKYQPASLPDLLDLSVPHQFSYLDIMIEEPEAIAQPYPLLDQST